VADAGNADAIKAVTSAVLDDDVIEATFKARHLQVFDDPTIAGKVGDYVQKAKGDMGKIVVASGDEDELLRVIHNPGKETCIRGTDETVDDVAVVLRGGIDSATGKSTDMLHVQRRHIAGAEFQAAPETSMWPTGDALSATQEGVTVSAVSPALMTRPQ
jgi:hypothetical protein